MAVSRAIGKHARVMNFADTPQEMSNPDVHDSEAAAVLTNFVQQCGDSNTNSPSTQEDALMPIQGPRCRRISRMLEQGASENDTPATASQTLVHNPTPEQVIFPWLMCAS